jgi:hypothetical protein
MADPAPRTDTLAERVRDVKLAQDALRRAVRAALLEHKRAGNPIAAWRDGKVVWIAPEDIPVQDDQTPTLGAETRER